MDTIFALSSGQPPAAIAVIRISGPQAGATLRALAGDVPPPRRARRADLSWKGRLLDRGLILFFPGPGSATGEDLAELHLHGGRAVVAAISDVLVESQGLRAADPGEFTRRAFANGRIDLAEAEGLADLLAAETESQRRAALQLAGGALSRQVVAWTDRLLGLAAAIEAQLDFSDEDDVGDAGLPSAWDRERSALASEIAVLLDRPPLERLRDGVRVVIAGPPNAGKSTLLNAIVGREAAITSHLPGTTRDLIEAPIAVSGVPLVLIDSAGLRDGSDPVEMIGIARAEAAVAGADLVVWLGDPSDRPARSGVTAVSAKCDLCLPSPLADISVSARTGENMDMLVRKIVKEARKLLPAETETAANARHRDALARALDHIQAARPDGDPLLAAEELRQARVALDRVTGRAGVEDMLDSLFGRFCIGK